MQDVSNDLGEKKSKVDRVIQALMLEENVEVDMGEQEENENDEAGSVDAESEEVEDSNESLTV
ncbi:hypothetical protein A2U01_0073272 [Trifolium medium]|uniref:Uncharacterized protein n=1 Tax=Trifolium medium TaxID=97028 RepID=A0A392ST46_9FABA|nr:hypothetical protein [Trifolium medium]